MRIFDSSREHDTPIDFHTVRKKISESRLPQVGSSSIREIVRLVNEIEQETGRQFIRMEMGVPGLPPAKVGVDAEIEALRRGVASKYPMIEGVRELKEEISRFVKLFLDVDVSPAACVPTVGSMMGSMAAFLTANRNDRYRKGTVFLDPGFPVQKQQCRILGHEYESIDVYDCRGVKLKERLESVLAGAAASSVLYSNPNNPAWICFTEEELRMIGELSMKYDVIVIEDLAYFGMDYRQDYSQPGSPPFQPTVARYTNHYILLISSSKVFSYAGQRVGMMVMSDVLFDRQYPDLKRYYSSDRFGHAMVYGALYALSSGCSHSAQYALAAMLKAANEGGFNFIRSVREYAHRASLMKKLFKENGFHIVYDRDIDRELADGFYFTFSYPGFSGPELLEEMLYYGISSISLVITGSRRTEGLRACVSQVSPDQMPLLEERLKRFHRDHSG